MLQGLAFAIFYTFIGLPIGRWVDKTNRRNLIVLGRADLELLYCFVRVRVELQHVVPVAHGCGHR